jgi:hypothetical protein
MGCGSSVLPMKMRLPPLEAALSSFWTPKAENGTLKEQNCTRKRCAYAPLEMTIPDRLTCFFFFCADNASLVQSGALHSCMYLFFFSPGDILLTCFHFPLLLAFM